MSFKPNLETRGRLLRGSAGAFLLVGALLLLEVSLPAALVLLGSSLFLLFEAIRGWCALRACGIKTKI